MQLILFAVENWYSGNFRKKALKCLHRLPFIVKLYRNSRSEVLCKKGVLKKKRSRHRCFPENFAKFLRTATFIEHLLWLLLALAWNLDLNGYYYQHFSERFLNSLWIRIFRTSPRTAFFWIFDFMVLVVLEKQL